MKPSFYNFHCEVMITSFHPFRHRRVASQEQHFLLRSPIRQLQWSTGDLQ